MAEDYSIMEDELKQKLVDLKKKLHMKKVTKLGQKHSSLKKITLQRKQIKILSRQVEELEPTVSKIYSPQNAIKDHQIKGYLIYLLKLKDFFSREVETKKEIIQQREDQIKKLVVKLCAMRNEYANKRRSSRSKASELGQLENTSNKINKIMKLVVKLCAMRNEYAKKRRSSRSKASEFGQLENMSNKINKLEQRICSLKHEIKDHREDIMNMRVYQKQYKKFENKFRKQIMRMTADVQMHLDRAVATYEEREDFVHKAKIYKERYAQDLRKIELNENALQLVLDKTEKYEDFGNLQNEIRHDTRVSATGDLIEQGVTGLEPELDHARDLFSDLVHSSGERATDGMERHFQLTDDQTAAMFGHLEQLMREIHRADTEIEKLKSENGRMLRNLTGGERKMRWRIEEKQKNAHESFLEASASDDGVQAARKKLDSLLEKVQSLRIKCGETKEDEEQKPDMGSEEGEDAVEEGTQISDSNAIDFIENIEKKILEFLMGIEYLRMKELSEDDSNVSGIGDDEQENNLDEIEETPKLEYLDTIQPRILKSKTELEILSDLKESKEIMDLEELKEKAVSVVKEIETEKSNEN